MKIHTTQNLSLLAKEQPTTIVSQNELSYYRLRKYNDAPEEQNMTTVSFKGKMPKNSENSKKIIDMAKKALGDIKDKAEPETRKGDKFLMSSFFNALLKLTSNEPVFTAVTAAIICIVKIFFRVRN